MMLDLKNEHHFDFDETAIKAIGCTNCNVNGVYAYTDLAFRIRYSLNGIQKETGHIGRLRLTAQYQYFDEKRKLILSYRRL